MKIPDELLLGDGRQPRQLEGLPRLRGDHEEQDRRPRLRADLAALATRHSCSRAVRSSRLGHPLGRRPLADRRDHAVGTVAVDRVDAACAAPRGAGGPPACPTRTRARRSGGTATPVPRSTRCGACSSRRSRSTRARTRGVRAAPRSRVRRSECTSLTAGSARSGRSTSRSGLHTQSRSSASYRRATSTSAPRRVGRLHVDRALVRGAELARRRRRAAGTESSASSAAVDVGDPAPAPAPADDRVVRSTRPRRRPDSHTSVSSPVAPAASARSKAGIVFSGSSRRAPRWANVMTISRSRGRRAERGRRSHAGRPDAARDRAHRFSSDPWGLPKGRSVPTEAGTSRSTVGSMTTRDGDGAVTTIRANCPSCGDVQLTADDLTVRVCADDERGSYCFRCPDCQGAVAKEASRRIVDLLVSSGVRMQVWRLPAELTRVPGRRSRSRPTTSSTSTCSSRATTGSSSSRPKSVAR